jgi:hypothetical protein
MGLLRPAENETGFLKIGIMGFQGSGKTFTASRIAAGVVKYAKIEKPKIAMLDTEKSSDFLVDFFKQQGIQFSIVKSRAFKDLCAAMREAEDSGYNAFIIDSVTHVWNELLKAYGVKTGTKEFLRKLQPCKTEWAQFTDLFINSKMHVLALGRAGYQWERELNEETGKKELMATGTKFKAEGEFGYESDLLLEMERLEDPKTFKDIHRCWVRKDRWDLIDGKYFDEPTFDTFLPVVKCLSIGAHHGFDESRDSTGLFEANDNSYFEKMKARDIALEELQATLIKFNMDGTSADAKKLRVATLENVFGTSSKTALENLGAVELKRGIQIIKDTFDDKVKSKQVPLIKSDETAAQQ